MAPKQRMPFKLARISSTVIDAMRDLGRQSAALPTKLNEQANLLTKRERRHAAIMSMHGIWKNDPTKPHDGVEYQREVRDEWQ